MAAPARTIRAAAAAAALVLAGSLAACSTGTTTTGASPSASVTKVATVAKSDLAVPGQLKFCADFPAPPGHFMSPSNQMQGYDIDLGNAVAARLGLTPVWADSVFDTIILAAQTHKCDMIWSGMSITTAREKVVSMIPYFSVGEALISAKGNPSGIADPATDPKALCGHTIAAEQGS